MTAQIRGFARALRATLPAGGTLPPEEFERRHAGISRVLWVSAVVLPVLSLAFGSWSLVHQLAYEAAVLAFAIAAQRSSLSRRRRELCASLSLLTVAGYASHLAGAIEAQLAFFVVIVVLTVYEDWGPFLLSMLYVFLDHGIVGSLDPHDVFIRSDRYAHPWAWAALGSLVIGAAGATAMVAWRHNESVRERMLEAQRQLEAAAGTDQLTGLGNRRRLLVDLEETLATATGAHPAAVVMFDLDGFKSYNDVFGHLAGDSLLARLGDALRDRVGPWGRAYRLGGDEFCVIVEDADALAEMVPAAMRGLSEDGSAFSVVASHGTAVLPTDARTVTDALRVADRRMYEAKASGRPSAGAQSKDVLLRALSERHPDIGRRFEWVAALAVETSRRLGCEPEEVEQIGHAAELHDIGKLALPLTILDKSAPLDAVEWEFIRQHTIVGERIVAAAPALSRAAALVRSSHERWDGTGYPDGLAGTAIPLGSRIIAICDALDEMLSDQAYQQARSLPEALDEIERCSDTQFDAAVAQVVRGILVRREIAVADRTRVAA